jgi:uroporphyrinogen-III synthase
MAVRTSLFVSRELTADSLLFRELTAAGFRVVGRSLLRFTPVAFDPPPATDWVFFYSSRAVSFWLSGLAELPATPPLLATMGAGTAATLEELLRTPDFVGAGQPTDVAEAFAARVGSGSVLFPRARDSRRSVQSLLPTHMKTVDLVVYDNVIDDEVVVPLTEVAVLTSPRNAEAYLAAVSRPAPCLVAIGSSTEAFLLAQGQSCYTADRPDEAAIAELVLRLR